MSVKTDLPENNSGPSLRERAVDGFREGYNRGKATVRGAVNLPTVHSRSLAQDNRAQVGNSATRAVSLVVGLMVGGLVAAFLLPVAVDEIVAVNTSDWGSGATSLWGIMDIIIVLAVFLFFIALALGAADRI